MDSENSNPTQSCSRAFTLWAETPVIPEPSRAFSLWTQGPLKVNAPVSAAPATDSTSGAEVDHTPNSAPVTKSGGGGFGAGLFGLSAAAVVALVFGILASDFRDDLKDLERTNRKQADRLSDLAKENDRLAKALQDAEKEIGLKLTAQSASLEKKLAGARSALEARFEEGEKKIAAEFKKVEGQMAEADTARNTKDQALDTSIAELAESKKQLGTQLAATGKNLTDHIAKWNASRAALEKSIVDADKKLTAELAKLATARADLEKKALASDQAIDNRVAKLSDEKAALEKQLAAEQKRVQDLLGNVQSLQGTLNQQKANLDQVLGALAGLAGQGNSAGD